MINYKLLTPGPLTTSRAVKEEMLVDHCTWDDDYKYITQKIRSELLKLAHVTSDEYTAVLMQGSGTFGVESVLTSAIGENNKLLILTNGAYGERMVEIAKYAKLKYCVYNSNYNSSPDEVEVEKILSEDLDITHISVVHCETTTGILNDIESIARLAKRYNKKIIIDAMSSFGGVDIDVKELNLDFIISSANKCIQGVPGFSFIICKKDELIKCKGNSNSLSLDLYSQWVEMEKDGKWRFTSPTHVVLGFAKAIEELQAEGGVSYRYKRYHDNNRRLIERMREIGFKSYIDEKYQSPIITSFIYPEGKFNFLNMYNYVKERGYAIYPGKISDADTFRIGNIGEIYSEDIEKICDIFDEYYRNYIE